MQCSYKSIKMPIGHLSKVTSLPIDYLTVCCQQNNRQFGTVTINNSKAQLTCQHVPTLCKPTSQFPF